ncbi:hypothetical protein G4B88_012891 [Cannabis sativa]|uniref:Uncharacterized protein n=1 Tax=Cannabis sativa TaxID=3483 RepID=A0A7J6F5C8_CANSA|nr:hypothetical protein G4B88_012891 [Cannabis sativa]
MTHVNKNKGPPKIESSQYHEIERDTTALRMQTTTFEKFKGLWKTLTEGTWSDAFDGLGMSMLLTWNPAFQYFHALSITCKVMIQAGDPNDDDGGGAQEEYCWSVLWPHLLHSS